MIRDAKKDYLEQLGDPIENAGGIGNKQFWHFAKSFLAKNSDSCLPIKQDGITCVGSKDKAELFNNCFISKSQLDDSEADIPPTLSYKIDSRHSSLHIILITEVKDTLLSLDTNKSIGPDGISPFFKWGVQELSVYLTIHWLLVKFQIYGKQLMLYQS